MRITFSALVLQNNVPTLVLQEGRSSMLISSLRERDSFPTKIR